MSQRSWNKEHETACDRFVAEQDNLETFVANLVALGFVEPNLTSELEHFAKERTAASNARLDLRIKESKA